MSKVISEHLNGLGQPVGFPLPEWKPPLLPTRQPLRGKHCTLVPLQPEVHAGDLIEAMALDREGRMWTYLPYGPFASGSDYRDWLEQVAAGNDPHFYAIQLCSSLRIVGLASYLRIDPKAGSIEVGHLQFSLVLQRTLAATEAMYLMMQQAFEWGYRRYEWKCDALNMPSRRAAERLGFRYEGTFRQALVVKGRNRDTAWFSILDREWPEIKGALERWMDPANFDSAGSQKERLSDLTRAAREI